MICEENNNDNDSLIDADEIDELNTEGSIVQRGKGRVYEFVKTFKVSELEENLSFKKNDDGFINYIEFEENIWKYKIKQKNTVWTKTLL